MQDHSTPSPAGAPPTQRPPLIRNHEGLLSALAVIQVDGWECTTATALLTFIREDLIRPLAIDVGLRGTAASQAEATAWAEVWLKLREPHLQSAASPWGVIWQTARRALLGEILAARWGTDARRAWKHHAQQRAGALAQPLPLDPLLECGLEPTAYAWSPPALAISVPQALRTAVDALVAAGWREEAATQIVTEVAEMEHSLSYAATVVGWRPLAARLDLPPWQARRLTFVLRGSADRPGLLAQLITEGTAVIDAPEVRTALASTLDRRLPSPTQRPRRDHERHPQRIAS